MMKKIAICITSLLSAGCLVGAALTLNPATPVGATTPNLSMVEGASVRLSDPTGLGFITRIDYDYYTALTAENVVTGTIILPTDYLTDNNITEITHATLNAAAETLGVDGDGEFYQDVENTGFMNAATAAADGYYEYRGSLAPLKTENYDRAFSAVGYIGVWNETSKAYDYEYTAYDVAQHSRAVNDVAFDAFVDRTATEQTVGKIEYKNAVSADSTYSPYTTSELSVLKGYMRDTEVSVAETAILQDEDGTLELSALNAIAESANFTTSEFTAATRNNAAVTFEEKSADVSLNGVYNLAVSGTTKYGDLNVVIPATLTASVDVWSEATKNVMIAAYDIKAIGGYEGQSQSYGTSEVLTTTVGEQTGEFYRVNALGAAVAFGKPLHTKEYYTQWLANNPYSESYVSLGWYFDATTVTPDGEIRTYDRFSGYARYLGEINTWYSGKTELSSFLANSYDGISTYYDTTIAEREALATYARYSDTTGVYNIDGESVYDYLLATKISNKMDYLYITPMTIELGEMKTYEGETVLVDRNSTTTITPALTTDEQAAVTYWENQGYTVSYELVKRYSDGTPILENANVANLGTYSFSNDSTAENYAEDGIYYLNAIATKDGVSAICMTKIYDIYDSTASVEYENFKHSDSEYAVVAYAAEFTSKLFGSDKTSSVDISWFEENLLASYKVAFGKDTSEGTWTYADDTNKTDKVTYSDMVYSATDSDGNILTYDTNTIYMLSINRETGYIEYDWSSLATHEKLDKLESAHSGEQGYIITQILPRHSKAYYENNKNILGDLSYKIRSAYGKQFYMTDIANEQVTLTYARYYSAADKDISTNVVATIDSLIDNYDAFAEGRVPMFVIKQIGLFTSSGVARLYEIGFESAS